MVGGDAAARANRASAAASMPAALEQELRTALGTKVDLQQKAGGRGQIVIHFTSAEEFDRLRGQLCDRARSGMVG